MASPRLSRLLPAPVSSRLHFAVCSLRMPPGRCEGPSTIYMIYMSDFRAAELLIVPGLEFLTDGFVASLASTFLLYHLDDGETTGP